MERLLYIFRTRFHLNATNLGLIAGFIYILCYFVHPYTVDDAVTFTGENESVRELVLMEDHIIIIATVLTALALYFASKWTFGLTGSIMLMLWGIDLIYMIMQEPAVELAFTWLLVPVAAIAMILAGYMLSDSEAAE